MDTNALKNLKYFFILLFLLSVSQTESKRGKGGGGGKRTNSGNKYTTPRSHQQYTTPHYHHTTQNYHRQDIGFENVQNRIPPQNNQPTHPIGFNVPQQAGSGHQPQAGDTFHKTNVNQVSNSNPSAPVAPSPNKPGIGFENVQNRIPPQNNQPAQNTGFNVPQNAGGGYHPQSGALPPPNNPNYGLNQPPYSNIPPNAGSGYHPQTGGFPQNNGFNPPNAGGGYHPQSGGFPQNNGGYHPQSGGFPQNPGFGGGHPGNYYQNNGQFGGGGVYNPHSYYNPHYSTPNGIQPQIYQPVQQSSGSSLLGYAASFGGGYLIGKLTSGGHNSDDRQYTVHHYHHGRDDVPKEIKVSDKSLVTCSQNDTQGLCVPNTFPICLHNGTIMCATHTPYTVPCGINSTTACVITVLPCVGGNSTCDNSTANLTTTAVYVPCISNVTVAKRRVLDNTTSSVDTTTNPVLNTTNVELCITAIAEPNKMESPVRSYLDVISQLFMLPIQLAQSSNNLINNTTYSSTNSNLTNNTIYSSSYNNLMENTTYGSTNNNLMGNNTNNSTNNNLTETTTYSSTNNNLMGNNIYSSTNNNLTETTTYSSTKNNLTDTTIYSSIYSVTPNDLLTNRTENTTVTV